jgi:hypothetical protein
LKNNPNQNGPFRPDQGIKTNPPAKTHNCAKGVNRIDISNVSSDTETLLDGSWLAVETLHPYAA